MNGGPLVKQLRSVEQKRLHRSWQRRTEQRVALLLDGVQDPFNVGSIVRTAAALRVEHLYLSANATAPSHPKVGKTALGTERYLEWTQHERVAERRRGRAGRRVRRSWASSSRTSRFRSSSSTSAVTSASRWATRATASTTPRSRRCDIVGYIPQLGRVGSLNVAAATAVALYEARRQGWQAP